MRRLSPASLGMPAVLVLLCAFFTWATYGEESPTGRAGGEAAVRAAAVGRQAWPPDVVVAALDDDTGRDFAAGAEAALRGKARAVRVLGDPAAVRAAIEGMTPASEAPVVLAPREIGQWTVWSAIRSAKPVWGGLQVVSPAIERRSAFLSSSNLRNVADQISVIAIIAVGMTMVIVTAGIDLSVGSLVALSAVVTAWLVRAWGGQAASPWAMLGAALAAASACGAMGCLFGVVITRFRVPPFIATLAGMQVASGVAFIWAQGQTIYDVPDSATWLGRGTIVGIPNAVALMVCIYIGAHVIMARTAIGRRIYAVGGNAEASRLSGVSVQRVLLVVYFVSGLMAGVGGVVTASQLRAGSPTYGAMYELYVIAAVVVGGTSLSGGEGSVFGTLIGALIIGVIRNGMNLTGVEPYTQKVVLGLVILGAVLLDQIRRGGVRGLRLPGFRAEG